MMMNSNMLRLLAIATCCLRAYAITKDDIIILDNKKLNDKFKNDPNSKVVNGPWSKVFYKVGLYKKCKTDGAMKFKLTATDEYIKKRDELGLPPLPIEKEVSKKTGIPQCQYWENLDEVNKNARNERREANVHSLGYVVVTNQEAQLANWARDVLRAQRAQRKAFKKIHRVKLIEVPMCNASLKVPIPEPTDFCGFNKELDDFRKDEEEAKAEEQRRELEKRKAEEQMRKLEEKRKTEQIRKLEEKIKAEQRRELEKRKAEQRRKLEERARAKKERRNRKLEEFIKRAIKRMLRRGDKINIINSPDNYENKFVVIGKKMSDDIWEKIFDTFIQKYEDPMDEAKDRKNVNLYVKNLVTQGRRERFVNMRQKDWFRGSESKKYLERLMKKAKRKVNSMPNLSDTAKQGLNKVLSDKVKIDKFEKNWLNKKYGYEYPPHKPYLYWTNGRQKQEKAGHFLKKEMFNYVKEVLDKMLA